MVSVYIAMTENYDCPSKFLEIISLLHWSRLTLSITLACADSHIHTFKKMTNMTSLTANTEVQKQNSGARIYSDI